MRRDSETPEQKRERLRQEELKQPMSSIQGSNVSDSVGSFVWKGTGLLILLLVVGLIIYASFFQ